MSAVRAVSKCFNCSATVGELRERRRVDREAFGGLLEHLLGGLELMIVEQRAAVERLHLARGGRRRSGSLQRFERLADRIGPVVPRLGDLEPDASERAVEQRLVGRALERASERQHRQIRVPGPRVRQADGDAALDCGYPSPASTCSCSISSACRFERAEQVRQFLARSDQTRATVERPSASSAMASVGLPFSRKHRRQRGSGRRPI